MKLVKHTVYEMYYLQWEDGVRSRDFYSLTRAKDHVAKITSTMARRSPTEVTDAFK